MCNSANDTISFHVLLLQLSILTVHCTYRKTAMNFNPPMCRAGKICIAEVEEIVEIDEIPPNQVIEDVLYIRNM